MISIQALEITPEMLQIIAELEEFKGEWKLLKNISPDRLASLRKVAAIESVGSSTRIEGVKLTDKEIEALLSNLDTTAFRSRDEEEVAGYATVMEQIFGSWESIPLTENYIKQLHQMLLQFSSKDQRHRGEYKTLPNSVEAFNETGKSLGVIFQTTSPFETPAQMTELVLWAQRTLEDKSLHALLVIAIFTVVFLAIHPFQDGNGRLSRVLTTLLLLKAGYTYVPFSSLESIIEDNKESYYLALRRTQGTLNSDSQNGQSPDWHPWILFFLRSMQKQKRLLAAKIGQEPVLEQNHLPELSVKILQLAKVHGRIKTQQIENATGESRSTIKSRLNELVQSGDLARHGQGRSTWYSLV